MQAVAAYFIFILVVAGLGLTIIFVGVLSVALYEGARWLWSRLRFSILQRNKTVLVRY
jgi:hypothetical protein